MKFALRSCKIKLLDVAPARERGLKSLRQFQIMVLEPGRSREGAWIEIIWFSIVVTLSFVAPARERGLKYTKGRKSRNSISRSREGAWIEIHCNR